MLLVDKSGIKCDTCGMNFHTDFKYYSFDFREVNVYGPQRPALESIIRSQIVHSCDVCEGCFEGYKASIIENNVNIKNLKCDITGESLANTKRYYYCVVSKVGVSMAKKLAECKKCKQKAYDNKVCTKCGHNEFIRLADTVVDERYVEIIFSQKAFEDLRSKAAAISSSDWSSKS